MFPEASTTPSLSKNHRLVYEIVQEQGPGRHLGMADVFALAKVRQPAIGFTTVYRALIRMRELGLVSEITLPGADYAYYEPAGSPHAHFRCTVCGEIRDVTYEVSSETLDRIAGELGGEVTRANVTLDGRCAACKATSAT